MGLTDSDNDFPQMTVAGRPVRIRNYSYALARLSGFVGAVAAFGIIGVLVVRGGGRWADVILALSLVTALMVWTGHIALRSAWRLDVAAWGVRVQYLLGRREFRWRDISCLRLGHETTYVDRDPVDIPLLRHRVLELKPIGRGRIVIVLSKRELPMARRLVEEFRRRRQGSGS